MCYPEYSYPERIDAVDLSPEEGWKHMGSTVESRMIRTNMSVNFLHSLITFIFPKNSRVALPPK